MRAAAAAGAACVFFSCASPPEPAPVTTTTPPAETPASPPLPDRPPTPEAPKTVGTATMDADGTIVMDMFNPHARITYKKGDAKYDEVLQHIGGMKPGESKAVPAWPDGFDENKVNDAVIAWAAKKGWNKPELRFEIMGTNSDGSVVVSVGHGSEHTTITVDDKTYQVR